jgi:nucleoside-diphosphate-sugar epimerase
MAIHSDRTARRCISLQGASVLITGGTGFIGGRLVEVLAEQFDARTKVVMRTGAAGPGAFRAACYDVEFVEASILDEKKMQEILTGVDVVFHCAFGTHGDERQQRNVTVEGTRAMIGAAAKAGVKHFVHLSTYVAMGDQTPEVVDETFVRVKPWPWPYAIDKWDAEQIVLAQNKSSGLPTTTIRLGAVYGPWGPAFTTWPLSVLATNRMALVAEGQGVSSATYIDDAVQGIILAAQRPYEAAETYIIGGPDRVTWREFYGAYEDMIGEQRVIEMTAGEIEKLRRLRVWTALRAVLPTTVRALKDSKGFKRVSADLPLVRSTYAMLQRRKGSRDQPGPAAPPSTSLDPLPINLPLPMMMPYFSSKTQYSIKKAETELGFCPQYHLRAGMALTAEWARWARLL